MKKIKTLFLGIGGVFLTNGWDTKCRKEAVAKFSLNPEEVDKKHRLIFDTFEIGKLTLDDYIDFVVFDEKRHFSKQEFKQFMFDQSKPFSDMLEWIVELKKQTGLKMFAVSNEGKELMEHRIDTFGLENFIDCFIVSGFVGVRKPDLDIFKLALKLSNSTPDEVVYIDDRLLLTEIANKKLGIHAICHKNLSETKQKLQNYIRSLA